MCKTHPTGIATRTLAPGCACVLCVVSVLCVCRFVCVVLLLLFVVVGDEGSEKRTKWSHTRLNRRVETRNFLLVVARGNILRNLLRMMCGAVAVLVPSKENSLGSFTGGLARQAGVF